MTVSRTLTVGVAGGALVAAVAGAVTRPFTTAADIVVTVAIVALVAVTACQRLRPMLPRPIGRRPAPQPRGPEARWGFWIAALLLIGGWELCCFAGAPRRAHPTLSSLLDSVTVHPLGRGVVFLGWLALGWYAVTL